MGCFVDMENMASVHMRVPLRRGQARMTEKFLNCTKIRPTPEKVRREAVSERMWTDPGGDRQGPHSRSNQASDASICQSTTAMIDKERVGSRTPSCPGVEIGAQGLTSLPAKEDDPLLPSLPDHPERSPLEVERSHVQAHELRATKAGSIEQLQDRPGTEGGAAVARDLDQGGDFDFFERLRNPSLEAR